MAALILDFSVQIVSKLNYMRKKILKIDFFFLKIEVQVVFWRSNIFRSHSSFTPDVSTAKRIKILEDRTMNPFFLNKASPVRQLRNAVWKIWCHNYYLLFSSLHCSIKEHIIFFRRFKFRIDKSTMNITKWIQSMKVAKTILWFESEIDSMFLSIAQTS